MNWKMLLIAVTLTVLSSCTPKEQTLSSSERPGYSSEESLSFSSETSSPIEANSSEGSSLSLSDDKQYCTVSIYQSYPIRPDALGRTGVRFDMSFNVEEGSPLYTNDEEMYALTDRFTPVFEPYGEAFSLVPLFYDKECTVFYVAGTPILSDSTFYYYMAG